MTSFISANDIEASRRPVQRRSHRVRRRLHRQDSRISIELPHYFVDRYAFKLVTRRDTSIAVPELQRDRDRYLLRVIKSTTSLGGWKPEPQCHTEVGAFYQELRQRWAKFARSGHFPPGVEDIPDAAGMTWRNVFDSSVFYPGPPVFRGATYLDMLDPQAVRSLISDHGLTSLIDFFCFMGQVHEQIHWYQVGEPLLNEVVQASIWSQFLSQTGLWSFQRDRQRSLIREQPVVERFPELVELAAEARPDTSLLAGNWRGSDRYSLCCDLGRRFDLGLFKYSDYLSRLTSALEY